MLAKPENLDESISNTISWIDHLFHCLPSYYFERELQPGSRSKHPLLLWGQPASQAAAPTAKTSGTTLVSVADLYKALSGNDWLNVVAGNGRPCCKRWTRD